MIKTFNYKSSQNFQNFPSRGKTKNTRRGIVAPKDHVFVAFDYSQLEARVLAMASKDKNWCESIWDNVDIHGRWATRVIKDYPSVIGVNSLEEATKEQINTYRKVIKNALVFPWLYGASVNSVMRDLNVPDGVIQPINKDFWIEYDGAKRWQGDVVSFFNEYGYALTLTNRKRHRPLSFNEIINAPIQGSASDIVIEAGNRLARLSYTLNKPQLQFKLNIHDDLSFYLPLATYVDDIVIIAKEMVNPTIFNFINVPLGVECSVGANWCDLEKKMEFSSTDFYNYNKIDSGTTEWYEMEVAA